MLLLKFVTPNEDRPLHSSFSHEVRVRIDDINEGCHLEDDAVLSSVQAPGVRILKPHGRADGVRAIGERL